MYSKQLRERFKRKVPRLYTESADWFDYKEPDLSHLIEALGSDYAIDGVGKLWYFGKHGDKIGEYFACQNPNYSGRTDCFYDVWDGVYEFPTLDLNKGVCEQSEEVCERLLALMK